MIVYSLRCGSGHTFEGWFSNGEACDGQLAAGLVACPECGSAQVGKGVMAPNVVKGSEPRAGREGPPATGAARASRRAVREAILEATEDVGRDFAREVRRMHEGRAERRPVRGSATPEEIGALAEDGLPVAPIPPSPETMN